MSEFTITRATDRDDLADVEALQRLAFTNAWGAEALRWELQHTDVARLYVMRTASANEPGGVSPRETYSNAQARWGPRRSGDSAGPASERAGGAAGAKLPRGPLVAYCACWLVFDELHINSLAVDPAWRRRGLARRLLRDVFRDAVAAGARSATLEVRQSNIAARLLYERLGFRVEGVRRDYYQEPREDALVLWHRCLPGPEPLC